MLATTLEIEISVEYCSNINLIWYLGLVNRDTNLLTRKICRFSNLLKPFINVNFYIQQSLILYTS